MVQKSIREIVQQSQAALTVHGAEDWIADCVADAIGRAEERGNRICGLYYLESYCQQLRSGRVQGRVDPVVSQPRPGTVQVDARFGFAQPAFSRGLDLAVQAARDNGIAQLAVGHAHTCTALGYFTRQIAAKGLIGIGFTNASPIVAPPGGKTRVIGTNPIACTIPDGTGDVAMEFDFSTTSVALGKITMAKAAGQSIPLGWALDSNGNPTTDPEEALKGSLVSAGGHKGWGFGLLAEVLAAAMTGSVNSVDVRPLKAPDGAPHDLGQFYLLIDPSTSPDFADRIERLAGAIAADGAGRMPGSVSRRAGSVEVDDNLWKQVLALATA